MLKWILNNKEWIFSGIGVAVIVAMIGWIYRRISRQSGGMDDQRSQVETISEPTNAPETHWNRLISSSQKEPSKDLKKYDIEYTPACLEDLARLRLTQDDLFTLVQSEFRGHLNYFRFDLEDYMMPVRASCIVYMDKIGNSIVFKRILPCTKNEAKLSSWTDILAIYRRATRLAYREDPYVLFTRRGQFGATADIHLDIERRIVKHFQEYEDLVIDEFVMQDPEISLINVPEYLTGKDEKQRVAMSVSFHVIQSTRARSEGYNIVKDLDNGLRSPESAVGDLVACLERSLQHIHKVLILFPPTGSQPFD